MFCDNLVSLRKLHDLSQEELADRLQVSRQTLSKYETGESLPDIERCKQLAEIFGVSVDELIYPPKPQPELPVEPESDAKSVDSTYGRFRWKHFFITLLSVAGVWLVAFLLICLFQYLAPSVADLWDGRVLCYALAGSFVVFLIFASLWWERAWIFIAITGIIWAGALSVFVTFHTISGAAVVFALAGVLELPVVLCYFWRCAAKHQWLIPYPFPRKK